MDRPLEKNTWSRKRIGVTLLAASIGILIVGSYFLTRGDRRLQVEAGRITIFEVTDGSFGEFIAVAGSVMPIHSIYLDASVGGRVAEKFAEDGDDLRQGDPILRLSNTDLELSLLQQETQVLNLLTQSQIAQTNAQQVSINNRNQLANVENSLQEARRVFELNRDLFEAKAIGSQEYQKALNEYRYQQERMTLTREILRQDSISTSQKLQQDKQLAERTQRALEMMQNKVGDLILRAPVDGQLTAFDAEIGQSKSPGERLGQLDVLTGFKVRADIDEHYISRIYPDLLGEALIEGVTYGVAVRKVYSQVSEGNFQVDLEFTERVPPGIRRGQSIQIRLSLSDITSATLLKRGGFYQRTGGMWIFKLDEHGRTAYRTDIRLGRQNPNYYEVLDGLQPGDKVIISSYENYDKIQELRIRY